MNSSNNIGSLAAILALTGIQRLTPIDIKKLLDFFSEPGAIFESDRNTVIKALEPRKNIAVVAEIILRSNNFEWAEKEIDKAEKLGVSIISIKDENYPRNLKYIPDPPPVIYVTGKITPQDSLAVAVVGTRKISNYGRITASRISRDLAQYDITVVSGLARGVDSVSHWETVNAGGRTIAVMATGADITYPPENRRLRDQIEENGAVVTEFPLGTTPDRWRFPVRNRIISGLSLGCLVVEAPVKSGALITARLAMEYNREVFAIPGNITCNNSSGCNRLIKEGAKPVSHINDILEEFNIEFTRRRKSSSDLSKLSFEEKQVYDTIGEEGTVGEIIIQKCTIPAFKVNSILMQMELKGFLKKLPGNIYVKNF